VSRGFVNPFKPLSAEERSRYLSDYAEHLRATDGEVQLAERRLSEREKRMVALEAWAPSEVGEHVSGDAQKRSEWLLAATKANEGESYGVEIELSRFQARGSFPGFESPDLMLRVLMQESYHCRILAELCRTAGASYESARPALPTRMFVAVIERVQATVRWAIVLAGECVGATLFWRLREALPSCGFAPSRRDRLDALIREIWADEVLHVAFLRAALSPTGLRLSRLLLPIVAFGVFQQVPDLRRLGCTPSEVLAELRRGIPIPAEIGWLDSDVPAEPLATLGAAVP